MREFDSLYPLWYCVAYQAERVYDMNEQGNWFESNSEPNLPLTDCWVEVVQLGRVTMSKCFRGRISRRQREGRGSIPRFDLQNKLLLIIAIVAQ